MYKQKVIVTPLLLFPCQYCLCNYLKNILGFCDHLFCTAKLVLVNLVFPLYLNLSEKAKSEVCRYTELEHLCVKT